MTHGIMAAPTQEVRMSQEMSADQVTPDMVVEQMPQFLDASKAQGTNATIQFDLSGQNAGKWWVKIHDGTAESGKGEAESPNLTLLADSQDWTKIMLGQMDPTAAFMQGKLKIKGDMGLAIRMQSLFKRPA
jgi:putative sterol carrier protein